MEIPLYTLSRGQTAVCAVHFLSHFYPCKSINVQLGIGLGLVANFLARNNTIVVAAVRDPDLSAKTFATLLTGTDSKLIVVKIDSNVASDAADAVKELKDVYGITRLDVVR